MSIRITPLPESAFHNNIPRINQADSEIRAIRDCPFTHCAPVTIAQSLIGLATRVPRLQMLLPPIGTASIKDYQSRIIKDLATDMGTSSDINSPTAGTTPQQLIDGLQRFIGRRNFTLTDTEWRGWGAGEIDENLKSPPPNKLWLANGLARDDQEVTEHIGWYVRSDNETYIRRGGHFITAVGYEDLGTNNETHFLHDPSPRSKQEVRKAKPIEILSGKLDNGIKGTENATGYLILDGIDVKPERDFGIIDGAFVFSVERKK